MKTYIYTMDLVTRILNILNSMESIGTVLYESAHSANLRIDRKPSPYAILYLLKGTDIDIRLNSRDVVDMEVFFCEPSKLDATGPDELLITNRMMNVAKEFVSLLIADKAISINDTIEIRYSYGRFDKTCSGVSVELTIRERQSHCIDSVEPSIRTLTITENGEYDTTQYGKVVVNIPEPEPPTPSIDLFYIKNEAQNTGTLTVGTSDSTLKCSTDGVTWFSYSEPISVAAGVSIYMKANGGVTSISMDVNHSIGGNIMSIVDEVSYQTMGFIPDSAFTSFFNGDTTLIDASQLNFGIVNEVHQDALGLMFKGCSSLTTPPDLSSITTLGSHAMRLMFDGCKSLTTTPDLSNVTTIGTQSLHSMFNNCRSLTEGPDLSGIETVADYAMGYMFKGCKSLVTPPNLSNVRTIGANAMREMFYECTSLRTPPNLSNITSIRDWGMASMFNGCTSLTEAPEFSNLTSVAGEWSMAYMFARCRSLTVGPDLSNVTSVGSEALNSMFSSCSNLNTVYAPNVLSWANTHDWLYGVAASGIIYCPSQAVANIIPLNDTSGCPRGWTVEVKE